MRHVLGVVLLIVGCGGDDPCVTPTTWCDDGVLMRCVDGQPAVDQDCTALGAELGVMKACGTLQVDEDQHCVDLVQTSCSTVGASECGPTRTALRTCVATDFGMVWDSQSLVPTCMEGQRCHPTSPGELVCVTPPVETCAAEAHCDGLTLELCAGNPVDGYVLVERRACPTRCQTGLGEPLCD